MSMTQDKSVKYEVVLGLPLHSNVINGRMVLCEEIAMRAWMKYAKEYYMETNVYVSAIANAGYALYHDDWGCPKSGEEVVTFNCTANRVFVKDLDVYEKGVLYIAEKLKERFKQDTVTITRLDADIYYLTSEKEYKK